MRSRQFVSVATTHVKRAFKYRFRPTDAQLTGQTGLNPIFQGAADFDLELIERRTLDGHIQELIYRPTLHV